MAQKDLTKILTFILNIFIYLEQKHRTLVLLQDPQKGIAYDSSTVSKLCRRLVRYKHPT